MNSGGILCIRIFEVVVYLILRCVEWYCVLPVHDILDQIPYPDVGYSGSMSWFFWVSLDVRRKRALNLAIVGVFYTIPNFNTQCFFILFYITLLLQMYVN